MQFTCTFMFPVLATVTTTVLILATYEFSRNIHIGNSHFDNIELRKSIYRIPTSLSVQV
jgi:hypothetical protein